MKSARLSQLLLTASALVASALAHAARAQDDGQPRLTVQLGHASGINALAVSDDGRLAVTGGADASAVLWDVATGAELRAFRGHSKGVRGVAVSRDGLRVVTGGEDGLIILWDSATGRELRRARSPEGGVQAVALAPDGRTFAAGLDINFRSGIAPATRATPSYLYVWDAEGEGEPRRFAEVTSPVTSVAFSPDGRQLLAATYEAAAGHVAVLCDAATGATLRRFDGHEGFVNAVAISSDSKLVATAGEDGTARAWDAATGKELLKLANHRGGARSVAFSPDGALLLTTSFMDRSARVWDVRSGRLSKSLDVGVQLYPSAAFTRDGSAALVASNEEVVRWDFASGKSERRFSSSKGSVNHVSFSPDGRFVKVESYGSVVIWDARGGLEPMRFENTSADNVGFSRDARLIFSGFREPDLWDVSSGAIVRTLGENLPSALTTGLLTLDLAPPVLSPDARTAATCDAHAVVLWDVSSGAELRRLKGHTEEVTRVSFSPDGRKLLTGSRDKTVRLWDVGTGAELRRFPRGLAFPAPEWFSPDGRFVLVGGDGDTTTLYDAETGRAAREFKGAYLVAPGEEIEFSPDARRLLLRSDERGADSASLYDLASLSEVRRFAGALAVAFSPDGRTAATGDLSRAVRLWDVETGRELRRLEGHAGMLSSVAFSPDGRLVATGSHDGTTRLWDAATGRELLRLVSFKGGDWVAVTPEGRFDTNNLDGLRDIHWTLPDDPFTTLPLEIFMRDYYEPRLLARVVAGEQLPALRPLAELNRARPRVEIKSVEPQVGSPELVTVTVEVAPVSGRQRRGGREARVESGVYDLRLFRDGQLVAQSPARDDFQSGPHASPDAEAELRAWREATRVAAEAGEPRTVRFENVRLPRARDARRVEFAAYAFNEERVKSATARAHFDAPPDVAPARRRAYVVTVGVNEYDNPAFRDLRFAANDARLIQRVVAEKLAGAGEYEVVTVALLSEGEARKGAAQNARATKENLKAVLDALAGRADPSALARVPGGESLRRAAPEDLLLVSFSGHGYAGARGRFYLVPENTSPDGAHRAADEVLGRLVSSDELGAWLRDVDAGQMLLIIDACHSAASVEGGGFKPGPMGSRGLGQLAYDKGMRILAASQADDVALESDRLEQGLLTFALVREGLAESRADFRPRPDGRVTAGEWLQFAERRVPGLYEQVVAGLPVAKDVTTVVGSKDVTNASAAAATAAMRARRSAYQRPALFDFAARRADVVLARERP